MSLHDESPRLDSPESIHRGKGVASCIHVVCLENDTREGNPNFYPGKLIPLVTIGRMKGPDLFIVYSVKYKNFRVPVSKGNCYCTRHCTLNIGFRKTGRKNGVSHPLRRLLKTKSDLLPSFTMGTLSSVWAFRLNSLHFSCRSTLIFDFTRFLESRRSCYFQD